MIKLYNTSCFLDIRNGFIILHGYDEFYDVYDSNLISIRQISAYGLNNVVPILISRQRPFIDSLLIQCEKDQLIYNYIKILNYIYKQPKNINVMLNHLTIKILLGYEILQLNLIKDIFVQIIPNLLELTRLNYNDYHDVYDH